MVAALPRQVCEGVQHAHQKGVIHRDIKPSNILITIQDDKPVSKIIDFGVAKATSQKLTERTVYTELGQLIGTPEYMSPEQAEMTGIDIDTRTDVYSLGVVLYELLVGAQPFDAKTLRQSNFDDMRRTIREEEPPKPSTRLSRLGEPSTTAAKNRRVELRSLERELRGDLDWITMRTLEKDRTRRYGSASDLAADIRRHLNHEPVVASPPSTTYRATKFVRRHSMGVASATVIALLLIALVVGMAVQAGRIALERDRAEKEAAKAQSINAFLQGMLGSADPRFGVGRDVTVVEALDAAMEKIDESFRNEPEIEAAVRQTIGITYANLGRNEQGAELLRSALEIRKETLGSRHPDTVSAMLGLAFMEYDCGHAEEAEIFIREAVSISEDFTGQERSLRADALNTLATILTLEGDYRTPKQLYRESYEIFRDVLGSENHLTLVALGNLAGISHKSSDYDEAESMLREVLGAQRKILGEEHTDVALTMTHLANVLHDRGDYKDAEELHRDAVRIATKTDGDSHPAMAFKLASLAKTVIALGDCKEGLDIFERAVEIDKSNPREDIELLIARRRSQFSASLTEFQCYGDAEVQLLDALEMQMRRVGKLDEQTQSTFRLIVELYEVWGKPEKASEYRAMLAKPEETEQ